MAKILLLGIEDSLARELSRVLHSEEHEVQAAAFADGVFEDSDAQLVFYAGDDPQANSRLRTMRRDRPDLPLVVVVRVPDTNRYLDALEAGAADYCSPPFERVQMRWVLSAALPKARGAASV